MNMPTFIVLGAQRSGTTALHIALARHPEIYMPKQKEPWYFSYADRPANLGGPYGYFYNQRIVTQGDAYAQLFAPAQAGQICGEASTAYLMAACAETTAANLQQRLPEVKLVVLLRRPAVRAYSGYRLLRGLSREPLTDFRQAIEAEAARMAAGWPPDYAYWQNSQYARLLAPYYARFDPAQMRVYLYEEWAAQPHQLLADLFAFLGVTPTVDPAMLAQASEARAVLRLPFSLEWQEAIKPWLPHGLRKALRRWTHREQPPLAPDLAEELTAQADEEITALETLIGRDLSHWRVTAASSPAAV
jgi:hypothetical protein